MTTVKGYCDPRFNRVQEVFEQQLVQGDDLGASFSATYQGEVVVDDLDVPEDVKELLFDLDFDSTGNISHQDLKDICAVLSQIHDELGEGSSNAHVIYLMELVVQQVCRKKTNASFMEYAHLPEKLQKCFRVWDIDGDGHVDAAELMAAADAWQRLKKESALMKKLLLAACFVMALMFVGMFVMGTVTAELAKEFKAGGAGANPKMTSKVQGYHLTRSLRPPGRLAPEQYYYAFC